MDFNALQHKLYALDPSDPAEDLRKLSESAGGLAQENVASAENYVQESVQVPEGSLEMDRDYSVSDFAALAGVTLNESQVNELDAKAAIKRGWDNHNTLGALGIDNPLKKLVTPSKSKPQKSDKKANTIKPSYADGWKSFLQQHTAGLQKIAADPVKKKRFDTWMAKWNEEVEEETKSDKNKRHHKDLDDLERTIRKSPDGMDKDTQSHIDKRRKELTLNNEESKGLYYNVNKRKKAGTSRKQGHPKAPTAQAWKDAAKTAKKESVESIKEMLYRKLNDKK